jgi:hypothetical protein
LIVARILTLLRYWRLDTAREFTIHTGQLNHSWLSGSSLHPINPKIPLTVNFGKLQVKKVAHYIAFVGILIEVLFKPIGGIFKTKYIDNIVSAWVVPVNISELYSVREEEGFSFGVDVKYRVQLYTCYSHRGELAVY